MSRLNDDIRAPGDRAVGQLRMKAQVGTVGLINDQDGIVRVNLLGDRRDIGTETVIARGNDNNEIGRASGRARV